MSSDVFARRCWAASLAAPVKSLLLLSMMSSGALARPPARLPPARLAGATAAIPTASALFFAWMSASRAAFEDGAAVTLFDTTAESKRDLRARFRVPVTGAGAEGAEAVVAEGAEGAEDAEGAAASLEEAPRSGERDRFRLRRAGRRSRERERLEEWRDERSLPRTRGGELRGMAVFQSSVLQQSCPA